MMKEQEVPVLRFNNFSENYHLMNLGEIFSIFNGYAFSSDDAQENGVGWLKISDVGIQQMSPYAQSYLPKKFSEIYSKFIVRKGEYVIALTRPILSGELKIAKVDNRYDGALLNQRVGKILSDENDDFVYYLLQRKRIIFDIDNRIAGTDPPNFSPKEVNSIPCFIPDNREEQKKIADFLSAVDKKISLLKQKHSLLQQYKKGVMQQLFSQQIRFKDDSGKAFPDWQEKTLAELADKISNKNKDDVIKNVLTNSAKYGIVNQRDYFDKDIANENNLTNYSIVDKDDFVYNPRISESAPVGPIKRNHIGQGIMSPLYTVFRFKETTYLDYLELFFQTTYWHRYMGTIANFGARHDRMNITMGDFFKLPIDLPGEEEMQKIVTFVTALNKKIDLAAKQIELTQTFKKGLLQQMFV